MNLTPTPIPSFHQFDKKYFQSFEQKLRSVVKYTKDTIEALTVDALQLGFPESVAKMICLELDCTFSHTAKETTDKRLALVCLMDSLIKRIRVEDKDKYCIVHVFERHLADKSYIFSSFGMPGDRLIHRIVDSWKVVPFFTPGFRQYLVQTVCVFVKSPGNQITVLLLFFFCRRRGETRRSCQNQEQGQSRHTSRPNQGRNSFSTTNIESVPCRRTTIAGQQLRRSSS